MTLSKKMLIAMVSMIFFVVITISMSSFELLRGVVQSFEENIVFLNAQSATEQLKNCFEKTRNVLAQMVDYTHIYSILDNDDFPGWDCVSAEAHLRKEESEYFSLASMTGNEMLSFANIYLVNGVNVTMTRNQDLPFDSYEEVCNYLESEGIWEKGEYYNLLWHDIVEVQNFKGIQEKSIVCYRFLYDRNTMKRVGAIAAGISVPYLQSLFGGAFPGAMIIAPTGKTISGGRGSDSPDTAPDGLLTVLRNASRSNGRIDSEWDGQKRQMLYWKVANNFAYFVIPIDARNLIQGKPIRQFITQLFFIALVAAICACILSVLFVRVTLNGLQKLKRVVARVTQGESDARFHPKKSDEIAYVGLQFNHMLDQIEKDYAELQQKEEEKKNLELSLLQSKINPHLLYNTLDIVIWAIQRNDPKKAEQLLYALSDFFKRSLAKGREMNTLREELLLSKSYVELQCLMSQKDYRIESYIDPNTLDYEIPHLILQPIIENSIAHGFSGFREDGTIRVTAELQNQGEELWIHIHDDGIGIPPDRLEEINYSLNEGLYSGESTQYGLRNTARRIKNRYGSAYGIRVQSESGEFTEVVVWIPFGASE